MMARMIISFCSARNWLPISARPLADMPASQSEQRQAERLGRQHQGSELGQARIFGLLGAQDQAYRGQADEGGEQHRLGRGSRDRKSRPTASASAVVMTKVIAAVSEDDHHRSEHATGRSPG